MFLATIAVVAWIVAAPAVMLVYSSLTAGAGKLPFEAHELTLVNYLRVLTEANTYQLLWTTALFTIGSTTIGMSIAVLFAWLIERTDHLAAPAVLRGHAHPHGNSQHDLCDGMDPAAQSQ